MCTSDFAAVIPIRVVRLCVGYPSGAVEKGALWGGRHGLSTYPVPLWVRPSPCVCGLRLVGQFGPLGPRSRYAEFDTSDAFRNPTVIVEKAGQTAFEGRQPCFE